MSLLLWDRTFPIIPSHNLSESHVIMLNFNWLYLTCLPHTVQLGQKVYVPKTLQHLSSDKENRGKRLKCLQTTHAMKNTFSCQHRLFWQVFFMYVMVTSVFTSAPCRRSSPPLPSAVPPRRKDDDRERRHSSALCALTAETQEDSTCRKAWLWTK